MKLRASQLFKLEQKAPREEEKRRRKVKLTEKIC